jgi:hypothetical protein
MFTVFPIAGQRRVDLELEGNKLIPGVPGLRKNHWTRPKIFNVDFIAWDHQAAEEAYP